MLVRSEDVLIVNWEGSCTYRTAARATIRRLMCILNFICLDLEVLIHTFGVGNLSGVKPRFHDVISTLGLLDEWRLDTCASCLPLYRRWAGDVICQPAFHGSCRG